MPKKLALFASVLLLAAIALRADDIVDEIIARVDDQIITRSDMEKAKSTQLEELKQRYPSDWQSHVAKAQADTLRDLIDQQLLLERGKELGITGETELVKRLNQLRQQMGLASIDDLEKEAQKQGVSYEDFKEQIRIGVVTQQVIGQEVGGKLHISNEDIQDWYNKHQKELEGPEEIGLSEIMVSTQPAKENVEGKDKQGAEQEKNLPEDPAKVAEAEAKANQLLDQLKKGANFEDLAKKNSDGPTAAQGGTLGTFKRGELAKDLEEKTFSLKAGENTGVIRTRQGFIILKVTAHRAAGIPPLKDISDRIREAIYSERLEPAARAYLTKLREQAFIDIKPGYTDTGASPNQSNKPTIVAANNESSVSHPGKIKKKKKFLVF
jgi:peptidyl-prolyl cis-trans isomerase SurA